PSDPETPAIKGSAALPGRHGQFEKRVVKNLLTLWPNATAPARVFSHADLAFGSAAWPDSFSFSPLYLAPSATVWPTPFAVSLVPSTPSPSPTFLAPCSPRCVAPFTFESSAASAGVANPATPSENTATSTIAFVFIESSPSWLSSHPFPGPGMGKKHAC